MQIPCRTALQLVPDVLQPSLSPAVAEVTSIATTLKGLANGSMDNSIDTDALLDAVLTAWTAQRAADQRQLETTFKAGDSKGRGMHIQDELMQLLTVVSVGRMALVTRCMWWYGGASESACQHRLCSAQIHKMRLHSWSGVQCCML